MGQCSSSKLESSGATKNSDKQLSIFSSMGGHARHTMLLATNFLDSSDIASLARSSKDCHDICQAPLAVRMEPYARHLLECTVKGDVEKARALLNDNPKLLLLKNGVTTDFSGKKIENKSAWQAALCASDDDMLKMMVPFFDAIYLDHRDENNAIQRIDGRDIRAQQTQKIFPKGYETCLDQQKKDAFNFDDVIAAIDAADADQVRLADSLQGATLPATYASNEKQNSGNVSELTAALNRFRRDFTSQSLAEDVFNPHHLQKAIEVFLGRCSYRRIHDDAKRQLFWRQVVGFIQRFLPACYAQAYVQGLGVSCQGDSSFQAENISLLVPALKRSFQIESGDEGCVDLFNYSSDQFFCVKGLGFNYALSPGQLILKKHSWWFGNIKLDSKSLIKQKLSALRFFSNIDQRSHSEVQQSTHGSPTNRFFSATSADKNIADRIISSIVRGNAREAMFILAENPGLLLCKGKGIDYSGREFVGMTAWQAALAARDLNMLRHMVPLFSMLYQKNVETAGILDGQAIMNLQTRLMIPDDYDVHLDKQSDSVFDFSSLLSTIDSAKRADIESALKCEGAILPATYASIEKKNPGHACELTAILNEFRVSFTKQSLNEKVFNPNHLLKALHILVRKCSSWCSDKRTLFWCQIIGFIQRFLPACYAQAIAQGLDRVVAPIGGRAWDGFEGSLRFRGGSYTDMLDEPENFFNFDHLGFAFAAKGTGLVGNVSYPPDSSNLSEFICILRLALSNMNNSLEELSQSFSESQPAVSEDLSSGPAASLGAP
jgi:hypothetical protein